MMTLEHLPLQYLASHTGLASYIYFLLPVTLKQCRSHFMCMFSYVNIASSVYRCVSAHEYVHMIPGPGGIDAPELV